MKYFNFTAICCVAMLINACNKNESTDGIGNVEVNTEAKFNNKLTVDGKVASFFFGGTISTYGSTAIAQSNGTTQTTKLKELNLDGYRIPLKWVDDKIISSAKGGPTDISGDVWIAKLKEIGTEAVVVVGGRAKDNDISPEDAASMVKYFKEKGVSVKNWIIGNEPNMEGMTIREYCMMYNKVVDAMKAVDSSIKIGGPAWTYYDLKALEEFVKFSGTRADMIDYHHYGMGDSYLSEERALSETSKYEKEINEIRNMINTKFPQLKNKIEIQLGEYNWSYRTDNGFPGWKGEDRFFKPVTTVWAASVAGRVAKAGGRSFQYSDLNGALGLTFEHNEHATHFGRKVNDPMPIYYGLLMFTGGNLFRHFGNEFAVASTTVENVEVYASTSKNIVLINKDSKLEKTIHLKMEGVTTNAEANIWQTSRDNPFNPPTNKGIQTAKEGVLSLTIPPYSITTLVVK